MQTITSASIKDTSFLRRKDTPVKQKNLTQTDVEFLSRMEGDVETRRHQQFVNEIKKHPAYKPGMFDPPKSSFKEVSLTSGPIVKSHEKHKTGLETKKPYQWGPLGGFY